MKHIVFFTTLTATFLLCTSLCTAQFSEKDSLLLIYDDAAKLNALKTNERIDLLNNLANAYRFIDPDSIKFYADKALELNGDISYLKGYTETLIRLGDYYSDKGDNEIAYSKYAKANELIPEIEDKLLHVALLKSLALHYSFTGNLKQMLNSTYAAIDISQENSFNKQEALLRHNLGWFYYSNKLYAESKKEYLVADSLWDILGDLEHQAGTQSNIAINALLAKDNELFTKYNTLSRNYFKKTGNTLWHSRTCRTTATYYLNMNEPAKSLLWNKKSDSLLAFNENPRDQLEIYLQYAQAYFLLDELNDAKAYLNETLKLANKLEDTTKILLALDLSKDIESKDGNLNKALDYFKKHEDLEKVFERNGQNNNLKFLRAKLEFDRQKLLRDLETEAQMAKKNVLIAIAILVLSALLFIIYLIRKNSKNQQKANAQLKELNATKDKIFTIIGHDLKSPIGTLQELLSLYKDNEISEKEIIKMAPRLKTNVDQSAFTLNNLLTWANNQMSGTLTNPIPVAIKEHATQVVDLYNEKINQKNLDVVCSTNPRMKVMVDSNHLDIILRNLILNAIKFTNKNGQIQFNGKEVDDNIVFQIIDTGIGMSPSQINSILNSDSVKPRIGTNKEKGTGIGLQITKDLIELNGGKLEFESVPNKGTTVKISFPKA